MSVATGPFSYDTQLEWTNRAFTGAGLTSDKKTHAGRAQGAKHAELAGTPDAQIRRAGLWNYDALTNCYLTHIPRKFVRSMAGFNPSGKGNYYLPRAKVLPPASLVREIWPWVDEWLAWLDDESIEQPPAGSALPDEEEDRHDLAAQGFLRLLQQLRTILLQDSVFLRREFPEHPLWNHPVFVRQDYQEFAREVELSAMNVEEPEEIQIRKVVPIIAERLNIVQQSLSQAIQSWGSKTHLTVDHLRTTLTDALAGRISFTIHASEAAPASICAPTPLSVVQAAPAPSYEAAGAATTPDPEDPENIAARTPPAYRLSRTIATVPDLWREWTAGLGSGPSVQSLEDTYGAAWRPSQDERVFFSRRKVIINEIRTRQAAAASPLAAVEELKLVRQRANLSLYGLYKLLNQQKKRKKLQRSSRGQAK